MKNIAIALALVAVLAMTSACFAEMSFNVIRQADPAPGLESYLVEMTGFQTFLSMQLEGVHQANMFGGFPPAAQATLYTDTLPPNLLPVDTHFLFAKTLTLETPGGAGLKETNDKGNPAGLPPETEYGFKYGLGNVTGTQKEGFAFGAPLAAGTDFMQVVIPARMLVELRFVSPVGGVDTPFTVPIGVIPEPGTIVLLIAGALCLLVARFRK